MSLLHKLKIGLIRIFNSYSIDYTPEVKRYGNSAEFGLPNFLKNCIPNCQIKTNVIISLPNENSEAEIDCLLLYEDKLFAIEIKHWKGVVVEREDGFYKYKQDRYTDDVWEKPLKSPFRQVNRAVSMLKKQTNNRDWIQPIVYFQGASSVRIYSNNIWFDDASDLVHYIQGFQKKYKSSGNINCFRRATAADFIYSTAYRNLHCIIYDESLVFNIGNERLTRRNICSIDIEHHFSYDTLYIHLKDDREATVQIENGVLCATENRKRRIYSFSKIDKIVLG